MSNQEAEKIRVTIDLSKTLNEEIDRVARSTGQTKAAVMRMAVDYLLRAEKAKQDRMSVGAWKEEGGVRYEREFVGGI